MAAPISGFVPARAGGGSSTASQISASRLYAAFALESRYAAKRSMTHCCHYISIICYIRTLKSSVIVQNLHRAGLAAGHALRGGAPASGRAPSGWACSASLVLGPAVEGADSVDGPVSGARRWTPPKWTLHRGVFPCFRHLLIPSKWTSWTLPFRKRCL